MNNKYLLKIAAKLPSNVKHWVRERIKVDLPKHTNLFKAPGMDQHPAFKAGVKPMKERLSKEFRMSAKVDRLGAKVDRMAGKHEDSHYSRGSAIVNRVLSAKVKQ